MSPNTGQVIFYTACKSRLALREGVHRYRADSTSYEADLINVLEKDGFSWAITAAQDQAVRPAIDQIPEESGQAAAPRYGYEIAVTLHGMEETDQSSRLIVKREFCGQEDSLSEGSGRYFHHAVVSNWPGAEKSALEVLPWHKRLAHLETDPSGQADRLSLGAGVSQVGIGPEEAHALRADQTEDLCAGAADCLDIFQPGARRQRDQRDREVCSERTLCSSAVSFVALADDDLDHPISPCRFCSKKNSPSTPNGGADPFCRSIWAPAQT